MLGAAAAAVHLGVSTRRVRQMLADGVLTGERVGRTWVINSEQLRQLEHRRAEVGRPWSAASAWAVLALADGGDPDLSPVERSRARKRLARGLDSVAGRLDARAQRLRFYAHTGVLDDLSNAAEVVAGGVSAAAEHGADLVIGEAFEGYVRSGDIDALIERFGLDDQSARPNVVLRVVEDAVWPFTSGQSSAGRAVVALDLVESSDPRTRRAGEHLLELA